MSEGKINTRYQVRTWKYKQKNSALFILYVQQLLPAGYLYVLLKIVLDEIRNRIYDLSASAEIAEKISRESEPK